MSSNFRDRVSVHRAEALCATAAQASAMPMPVSVTVNVKPWSFPEAAITTWPPRRELGRIGHDTKSGLMEPRRIGPDRNGAAKMQVEAVADEIEQTRAARMGVGDIPIILAPEGRRSPSNLLQEADTNEKQCRCRNCHDHIRSTLAGNQTSKFH
jgi:hypothetical protein